MDSHNVTNKSPNVGTWSRAPSIKAPYSVQYATPEAVAPEAALVLIHRHAPSKFNSMLWRLCCGFRGDAISHLLVVHMENVIALPVWRAIWVKNKGI